MKSPQISVVTPSYNQAKFIEQTIMSVKNQDYDNIEHIVIDGGSTDGTIDILQKHEDDYNLRWVSEEDQGQTHAINKGIEMANGEWLGWLNSDDIYLEGSFQEIGKALRHDSTVDVVYGDLYFVDADGELLYKRYHTRPSSFIQRHWTLFTANHCTFFHKSVFETVGKLDESRSFTMDVELFERILQSELNCYHTPTFMGARRMHEETKTGNHAKATQREKAEIYNKETPLIPDLFLTIIAMALKVHYFFFDALNPSQPETLRWSLKATANELSRPIM